MSLSSLWRRNGRMIALVAGLTLAVLSVAAAVRLPQQPADARSLLLVQLWIMMVLMPLAAHRSSRPMDALCRAGITSDAFGLFMLVFGVGLGPWGLLEAIKLYLLASSVGLLLTGFFVALGCVSLSPAARTGLMAGLAGAVAFLHTIADRIPAQESDLFERLNLLSAAVDALEIQPTDTPWLVTLLIYAAAAGMCWSFPLVAATPRHQDV